MAFTVIAPTAIASNVTIRITVIYAEPDAADVTTLNLPIDSTIAAAVEASGILARNPALTLKTMRCGIFGRRAEPDTVLQEGDRVEIYRPLRADPKELRRSRVKLKS